VCSIDLVSFSYVVERKIGSRDSSVGTATEYGLDDLTARSSSPGKGKSFLHVVQTGSEGYPASYPMGTGALSPGVKRSGREAAHSPPASAEVTKM
jgi:hypothetical protein